MDNLDKKLFHDLAVSSEKMTDSFRKKMRLAIKEGLDEEYNTKPISIRILVTACATLLLTTGIVYAGVVISKQIWKQPEKTVGFFSSENDISEADKKEAISEVEARQKAKKLLKTFGYENEKIKKIKLDNHSIDFKTTWCVETFNQILLYFDAVENSYIKIKCNNLIDESIHKYRTSKTEAERTARNLCKKYGYDLSEYSVTKIYKNAETENKAYIWYVDFYKEYDGIINPYESINIAFVPEINKLYYFIHNDNKYEKNEIEISQEQAKQTVLDTEKKINTIYEINDINITLDIVKMNGNAYLRTNNYEQYCKQQAGKVSSKDLIVYHTDNNVRKAWAITLEYNISTAENKPSDDYKPFDRYYTYYIDVTTGEIIGGSSTYHRNLN